MIKYTIGISFATVLMLSSFFVGKKAEKPARTNYQTYCASCHGEKVEAFVDRKWKQGT